MHVIFMMVLLHQNSRAGGFTVHLFFLQLMNAFIIAASDFLLYSDVF